MTVSPQVSETTYRNLIAGELVEAAATLEVVNPADESVLAFVPDCGAEELDRAMAAASEAFKSWRKVDVETRRAALMKVADVIEENVEELGALLTSEQGKPLEQAMGEVGMSALWLRGAVSQTVEDQIIEDSEERLSRLRRVPLGVVAGIVPWNFPVLMAVQKLGPALLTGNTLVLKPSPFTPLATLRLTELIADVFPAGVLNIITGGDQLGPLMTSHPAVAKVSFTGSSATGKKVMESAAHDLKRITLELGGNDASIVMPDVDVPAVAQQLFWSSFTNAGQICIAAKRVYIHEDIYDEMAAALKAIAEQVKVGDGTDPETGVGPIQNLRQLRRVEGLVADAKERGLNFLTGGERAPDQRGYHMPITLLDNPPEDARIVCEEQFGPVLPLMKFKTIEEVVAKANDSDYGLAGAVWSADEEVGLEIAEQLETGTVWINEFLHLSPFAPFGGHKHSGFGAEFGKEGLEAYTYPQVITIKR
ncbi:MAG: aldehyde dehydrogenase family protein [Acidobacteriota bacterium]